MTKAHHATAGGERALLRQLFDAAVQAVDPLHIIAGHLPPAPKGRTIVIGAGKAAARMAQGVEQHWPGALSGLVVTRYGHGAPTRQIEVVEAGHPVPDDAAHDAALRMLDLVHGLTADDLVLCLMSGGGSALLSLPAPGLSVQEKREVHRALLTCGAPIDEMNCVRKHLSAIKGGRLALACAPARVFTLVLSDVPGDDPAVVASGPTLADASTAADALRILQKYAIPVSPAVQALLGDPARETPKPGDARLAGHGAVVIATAQQALEAAAQAARAAGYAPLILSNSMEGEAREVAIVHASLARQARLHGQPLAPPCVILSGGETSVTVRGQGRGGRNAEFLLALAIALKGLSGVHAIACDTDGIDGTEDNAGALLAPDTLARALGLGLDPAALLADNDGYSFFAALDDLLLTGPTRTNVNDFRAILVNVP
ncbi:glycerate kinase [Massilia sp. MB5]|uniref:glycerate kinase type-2 family protein n=1 Tax=unclassified Massilia TaxID=2609279 RepID=UPI00067CC79E|nr:MULTISPECIES: glycerate kinase [unclassified Massilia]AKU23412.1 hydroxypyruvate reductase [Massilia sp. NR 4-1]UMR31664.1 glycerate kinase [Massilia sp. MB5]